MISDYTYLYKTSCELDALGGEQYDVFLSAYTKEERVKSVFVRLGAEKKYWFLLPEYHFSETDLSEIKRSRTEALAVGAKNRGVKELKDFVEKYICNTGSGLRICIDSTGFIRPTLLFLMRLLHWYKIKKYDMMYSEPRYYKHREETSFSSEYTPIEPIYGFGGQHINSVQDDDLLIIGAGYEEGLVRNISEYKESSKKKIIYGFPPLQADMYQENRLRIGKISESIGLYEEVLVSASDPFATAQSLRKIVQKHKEDNGNREFNLDLSPLSTKAQTIGFGLYYITERLNSATNIIFPFAEKYSQETSEGIGRIWKYSIETR